MNESEKIAYFAETDFRGRKTKFGIKNKDRSRHIYIIGKTGMGKSTLLENLAVQDIQNDEGIIFIDPHGQSAVALLDYIPKHRVDDVVYFAPHDTDFPIAFNVLEQVPKERRSAVAGGLVSAFKKIWVDSFSSRMEYLMNYTLLALLDVPGTTLLSINRMLADTVYRKYILDKVDDPLVRNFWFNEYVKFTATYASEAAAPIQNKVGQFIASNMIRNIVGQSVSTFDFRKCMDEKKIVIINISKGIIGPENMRLLGGMLITKIQLAAMSRAELDRETLERTPNVFLYVDEFQNFANESFAEILSESRKYKLCLTVANQYVDQMTEEVRNAVIGNVGTMISFRVGSTDAILMEKEFTPQFTAEDMVNLDFTQIYLKLMIDGIGSRPFSATSLPPIPKPEKNYVSDIIAYSRQNYTKSKPDIEEEIKVWTNTDFKLLAEKEAAAKKEKNSDKKDSKKGEAKNKNSTKKIEEEEDDEIPMITQSESSFEDFAAQFKPEGADYSLNNQRMQQIKLLEKLMQDRKAQNSVVPPNPTEEKVVGKIEIPATEKVEKSNIQNPVTKANENIFDRTRIDVRNKAKSGVKFTKSKPKDASTIKGGDTLDEIPEDVLRDLLNI